MVASATAFAVHLGPDGAGAQPELQPALLAQLARCGLDPTALMAAAQAALQLRLAATGGWHDLNLGALLAAARARPGAVVAADPGSGGPPPARAVLGTAEQLGASATWALPSAPLPRIGAALLDRDGTIIEDRHYLGDPAGVALLPGAAEGMRHLSAAGVQLVVVTNQSGVGLSRITQAEVAAVHQRLRAVLLSEGIQLDGIYVCPHHPEAGCDCRKPADGLARQAATDLGLDLGGVIVAGDKDSDLGLGRRLGVPAFLVASGEGRQTLVSGSLPADYLVEDLAELARICTHPAGVARPRRLTLEGTAPDA